MRLCGHARVSSNVLMAPRVHNEAGRWWGGRQELPQTVLLAAYTWIKPVVTACTAAAVRLLMPRIFIASVIW